MLTETLFNDVETVEVTMIHGNASNGKYGVFGATEGVVLVDDQDNIELIKNVEGLNAESWLSHIHGHDNTDLFFGNASQVGVFKVDPVSKTMAKIYSGDDVINEMFNFNGEYYIIHTSDNKIRVFDAHNGNEIASRVIEVANIPKLSQTNGREMAELMEADEPNPVLVTSDKFLYVLAPNRTQIKVLEIASLKHVHTIELPTAVDSIVKNGFSMEGDQNSDHNHG
ncbi:hypothetical protein [Fulvivirga sediminis]|uniref:Uncharacterized protein n=1 Tax=Fulvivirga sediminis TaxID=2803949 RepID=A0A937FDZ8_9BACT|nr:hypothetical protein [Fulvivirga sediminis]MBL3659014.1 hypothetical protein [Fulvivirga sediminis]